MKTVEYLNHKLNIGYTSEQALDALKLEFGIKYSIAEEYSLVVLNYCQIDSPKNEQIVQECRSLVLTMPFGDYEVPEHVSDDARSTYHYWFQVVSRSFDRFFNYGEMDTNPDVTSLTFYDKLDGSLVSVFHHNNQWLYRTRSMIMPTSTVNGIEEVTWKGIIETALDWNNFKNNTCLCKSATYILEVVSPYNRVVTDYGDDCEGYLLSVRAYSGFHFSANFTDKLAERLNLKRPKGYIFSTMKDALKAQGERINLEEGVVGYDGKGVPVVKVKSPAYVAAHRLRGEGILNVKSVVELINLNEHEEYLAVFPKDTEKFTLWINAKNELTKVVEFTYNNLKGEETQKDFALKATKFHYCSLLFSMKKGLTFKEALDKLTIDAQIKLLHTILKTKENVKND